MTESLHGAPPERFFVAHEHLELRPGINRIHDVAVAVGSLAAPDLSIAVLDVLDWVDRVLEPHAAWENTRLYPEFDRHAGTAWATKMMVYEHHQIREIARRIAHDRTLLHREPSREQTAELRGHLFALEALIRAHIEREEQFLIPLLDEDVVSVPIRNAVVAADVRGST
jgi:iron-sulfur cluster repair protein YtfE (RIC family)